MNKIASGLFFLAMLLLATALPAGRNVEGTNPGTINQGIQAVCSDVDGSGAGGAADIGKTVLKFGTVSGGVNYRLLYDSRANGPVGSQDLADVAADFGKTNAAGTCPLVDTQIAQATLAIMDPTYSNMALCGGPCGGDTAFLTEDEAFLATKGYLGGEVDVPGQGRHYIKVALWDGVFNPARPEGLVYNNGKLVAQLYFVSGAVVGWGPVNPPPPDQNEIDAFCVAPCSWSGAGDGWHVHFNLCSTWNGTQFQQFSSQPSDAACAAFQATKLHGGTYFWFAQLGWMGHVWNHEANPNPNSLDITSNGRFADCFPDPPWNWKAFNCPQ